MKYLVLTLGLALASTYALAEADSGGKPPHGKPPAWQNEVGLSEEQREEMRALKESGASREEIRAVMTPEQQEKMMELRKGGHAGKGGGLERMQQKLDLTDEQAEEMRKIRDEGGSRRDMMEVLTPEQRSQLKGAQGSRGKPPHGGRPRIPQEEEPAG